MDKLKCTFTGLSKANQVMGTSEAYVKDSAEAEKIAYALMAWSPNRELVKIRFNIEGDLIRDSNGEPVVNKPTW